VRASSGGANNDEAGAMDELDALGGIIELIELEMNADDGDAAR
jgi:hypothetical protein